MFGHTLIGKKKKGFLIGIIKNIIYILFLFQEKRDDLINPYWIEDPELKKGEVDFLSPAELSFWKDLIDKYLYPIDANKEEQVKMNN